MVYTVAAPRFHVWGVLDGTVAIGWTGSVRVGGRAAKVRSLRLSRQVVKISPCSPTMEAGADRVETI